MLQSSHKTCLVTCYVPPNKTHNMPSDMLPYPLIVPITCLVTCYIPPNSTHNMPSDMLRYPLIPITCITWTQIVMDPNRVLGIVAGPSPLRK
jgi:hypothetical protein